MTTLTDQPEREPEGRIVLDRRDLDYLAARLERRLREIREDDE